METVFPISFSSSMFADIWKCEFYFFRKYCQGLVGTGKKNADLIAGGHIAKACELTRKAYYNEGKDEEEAISLGEEYILTSEDTGDQLKSNERVAHCFRKYFERFKLNSKIKPVALADGTFAIEYFFRFDLGIVHPEFPETNICFQGTLDGLYSQPYQTCTKISVLDEKSTKSIRRLQDGVTPDWAAEEQEWSSRGQFLGYHWAARKLGVKTDNTLVRRIPILSKFEYAYELDLPINKFVLSNWEQSTIAKIEELKSKYLWLKKNGGMPQRAFYPVYGDGCNTYKKPCPYKIGCLNKDGEDEIQSTHVQMVFPDNYDNGISLVDYKKEKLKC